MRRRSAGPPRAPGYSDARPGPPAAQSSGGDPGPARPSGPWTSYLNVNPSELTTVPCCAPASGSAAMTSPYGRGHGPSEQGQEEGWVVTIVSTAMPVARVQVMYPCWKSVRTTPGDTTCSSLVG